MTDPKRPGASCRDAGDGDLYHPGTGPTDQAQWQRLDELEQLDLVIEAHALLDEEHPQPEDLSMHAAVHLVVENQLLLDDDVGKAARATLERFLNSGFDRHEAVDAIGLVVARHLFSAVRGARGDVPPDDFLNDLRQFTPEEWRKTSATNRPVRPRKRRGSKRRARSSRRRS